MRCRGYSVIEIPVGWRGFELQPRTVRPDRSPASGRTEPAGQCSTGADENAAASVEASRRPEEDFMRTDARRVVVRGTLCREENEPAQQRTHLFDRFARGRVSHPLILSAVAALAISI